MIPRVDVTRRQAALIAARHGFNAVSARQLPGQGIINTVFALGPSHLLRVPRDHPAHVQQLRIEAATIPAAVEAGVRTASLIAFDDSCEILPVPYMIVERLPGTDLESTGPNALRRAGVWRELGRDLALLHSRGRVPELLAADQEASVDPRSLIPDRAAAGWISDFEADWLLRWIDQIEAIGGRSASPCLVHGDVQMSNVLVDPGTHDYVAVIDWGCAGYGEAAVDLRAFPMAAVPYVLEGYRTVDSTSTSANLEARIVWARLQLTFSILPRGAAPGWSWGERPVAWLADLLHFFVSDVPPSWRALIPPRSAHFKMGERQMIHAHGGSILEHDGAF